MFSRLTIEPTNHCNLACKPCPRHSFKMPLGFMDEFTFYAICDQAPRNTTIFPFWRGEALMHPQIVGLLYYAIARSENVVLATNGNLVCEETIYPGLMNYLKTISVSLHNMRSYQGYLWLFERRAKEPFPVTELVTSIVESEVVDIPQFLLEKLYPRVYKTHSLNHTWGAVSEPPNVPRTWCSRLSTDLVITWDGKVSRCCYVWEPIPGLDATKQTLDEIWTSPQLQRIRDTYPDPVCQQCDQWFGGGKTL